MSDAFISHSSDDRELANQVREHLEESGVSCFMAPTSIPFGVNWSAEVLSQLKVCNSVIFIATPKSCLSPYVNQELGGSLLLQKRIFPLTAEIPADQLPGWIKQFQASVVKEDLSENLVPVVNYVKGERAKTLLLILGLIAGIWVLSRNES